MKSSPDHSVPLREETWNPPRPFLWAGGGRVLAWVFLALASVLPTAYADAQPARIGPDFMVTSVKEGMGEPLASIDELVMPKVGRVMRYREMMNGDEPFVYDEVFIRLSFQERFEEDGEILNSSGDDYLKPGIGLVRRVVRNLDGRTVTELIAIDPES